MHVLVVDDDPTSVEILAEHLTQFGYDVASATNGREAFDLIRSGRFRIVISDWQMPEMDGLELCREVRKRGAYGYVYFILLTSASGVDNLVAGFQAGADDFLTKPFQPQELWMRIRTGERVLALEGRDLVIFAMAKLTESRDQETGAHLERMREYSRLLAEELSTWPKYQKDIDGDYVQLLYLTCPLHDIGKVAIPDAILLKPGKLTAEEFEVMKQHTLIGSDTLGSVADTRPEAEFLTMARDIALTHHERFDGEGYPLGLADHDIPLCGRIVALADVYDALTSRRIYKPAYGHFTARSIILEGIGTQFDPDVVEAFKRREQQFIAVRESWNRTPGSTPMVQLSLTDGTYEPDSVFSC
jgi:putative two-component system response regulator